MPIRKLSIAAVALLAAACGPNDELVPFSIQLKLADFEDSGCITDATCYDYGMHCGAKLGITIVDAESIYQASLAPDASPDSDAGSGVLVTARACVDVPQSESLCGVDEVSVPFQNVPARMAQIQVALWSPEALADYDDCPDVVFDLKGAPRLDFLPQPAFAGWSYFDVGKKEIASVSLECFDPDQLDTMECQPESTAVAALVDNMAAGVVVADQAPNLDVSVGEPRAVMLPEGGIEWVLEPTDTYDLSLVDVPTPYWYREDVPGFVAHGCVLVLDRLPPQAVASVACTRKEDFDQTPGEPLILHGLFLPDDTLENIMNAAGMGDSFPDQGLVIGRVVNEVGVEQDNVVVSTTDSDATIEYVDASFTGLTDTKTSSNGYFISRDAEWKSQWTAQHAVCGNTQNGTYVAGLIKGKITAVVIRMNPKPEGCD